MDCPSAAVMHSKGFLISDSDSPVLSRSAKLCVPELSELINGSFSQ